MARSWGHGSGKKPYQEKPNAWKGMQQTRFADGQDEKDPNGILKRNPSGEFSLGRDKNGGLWWTGQKEDFREEITPQGHMKQFRQDGSLGDHIPGTSNKSCSGSIGSDPDNGDFVQGGMLRANNGNLDNDQIAEAAAGKRGGGKFTTNGGDEVIYTAASTYAARSGGAAITGWNVGPAGAISGTVTDGGGNAKKGHRTHVSHDGKGMSSITQRGDGTTVIAVGNVNGDKGDYTLTIDPKGNMTIKTKGTVTVESAGTHTIKAPKIVMDTPLVEQTGRLTTKESHTVPFCHSCADKAKGSC